MTDSWPPNYQLSPKISVRTKKKQLLKASNWTIPSTLPKQGHISGSQWWAVQLGSFFLPPPPHLTQTWILWSNERSYKVNYGDQVCLSWPNWSTCQFSWQSDKVNSNFKYKNLQVGGGGRKKSPNVCHGLISLHANFHDNRTKWTVTSNIKFCRWGGGKSLQLLCWSFPP